MNLSWELDVDPDSKREVLETQFLEHVIRLERHGVEDSRGNVRVEIFRFTDLVQLEYVTNFDEGVTSAVRWVMRAQNRLQETLDEAAATV